MQDNTSQAMEINASDGVGMDITNSIRRIVINALDIVDTEHIFQPQGQRVWDHVDLGNTSHSIQIIA